MSSALLDGVGYRDRTYRSSPRVVVALAVLALAAYVYGVAEMAPIGAIPAIAADFGVDEAHVGLLTAAYALISIVATVPLVRWTARWPQRRVFVATLACLTVAQVLSALAPGLGWLAASRVLCAVTHGVMWAIIVPIGVRLVPATHAGRATAAVYIGSAAALVVGNPLTTSISQAWGWRPTVAALATASAVIMVTARVVLPVLAVDSSEPAVVERTAAPHRNTRLLTLCGLTVIGVSAHFVSYTFIVPIIRDVIGVGGTAQAWVLAAFGTAGLLALALFARAADERLRPAAAGCLTILCLALAVLIIVSSSGSGAAAIAFGVGAVIVWGATAAVLPPMLQAAAIRAAPRAAEQASALYVTASQVGILCGSVAGGLVYARLGLTMVLSVTAVLFAVTLLGVLLRPDAFRSPAAV